jgi:hypothetical protein
MKNTLLIISAIITLFSCNNSSEIPPAPKEPCKGINIWNLPVITHGFYEHEFDSVLIETYANNSHFDEKFSEYSIELGKVRDSERVARSFNLPKAITTNNDLKIIFSDDLSYKVTEMKTEWIPRWCQSFCGYSCTLSSFKLNGKLDQSGGNIRIKAPNFTYPWEKE